MVLKIKKLILPFLILMLFKHLSADFSQDMNKLKGNLRIIQQSFDTLKRDYSPKFLGKDAVLPESLKSILRMYSSEFQEAAKTYQGLIKQVDKLPKDKQKSVIDDLTKIGAQLENTHALVKEMYGRFLGRV